jgi:hypothetical protein
MVLVIRVRIMIPHGAVVLMTNVFVTTMVWATLGDAS